MRSFLLSKIIVPLHLAVIAGYLAWTQPGPDDITAYLPLAFLALGFAVMMLLFPSAKKGEDAEDARSRVTDSVRTDPLFGISILFLGFVLLQIFNGPRHLAYIRAAREWQYTDGLIRGFPACLDQLLSCQALFVAVIIALAALAVRNSLGRRGKCTLVGMLVAVSTLLGLYGLFAYSRVPFFDELGIKLPAPQTFATFADKSQAGAYFLMNSCAAFGLLFMKMVEDDEEEHQNRYSIRFLFAALVVNVVSALFTLSCLSMAVLAVALLVIAAYTFVFVVVATSGEMSLSTMAAVLILAAVAGFLHFVAYPENRLHDCTEKIFKGPWQTEGEIREGEVMSSAAWRMFADNAVGGVGASCFGIQSGFPKYVRGNEWKWVSEPDSTHWRCGNDLAQFMAEFGLVGAALGLCPFVVLAILAVVRLARVARYGTRQKLGLRAKAETDADRVGVFDILPPFPFALFVGVASATAMSFFVPVFGSHLNSLVWVVFFLVATTSIPKPARGRNI